MRILHISDIHYREKNRADIDRLVRAAGDDVARLISEVGAIDLIIFSGDLTFAGTSIAEFQVAYERTIAKIAEKAAVNHDRVLICPGNHDVSQEIAMGTGGVVEAGLKYSLVNRDSLNKFVRDIAPQGTSNTFMARLKPFYDFIDSRALPSQTYKDPFMEVHTFLVDGVNYGICLFNSAWRSTGAGEIERKTLLVGEATIQTALHHTAEVDVRCAVIHHPFEWLNEYDRHVVEPSILLNFDAIFHGHVHNSFPEQRASALGSSVISQAGCLYETQEYHNSYQLVDLNTRKQLASVYIRSWYDLPRGAFDKSLFHNDSGRVDLPFKPRSLKNQTASERASALSRELVYKRANEHVSMQTDTEEDFQRIFVCPPLQVRKETTDPSPNVDKGETDGGQ